MGKELSDMTLEELWELFPIFLVEHDDKWLGQYEEIEGRLAELLSGCAVGRISHIGSTAVDGILAKDIVDVLVELPSQSDLKIGFYPHRLADIASAQLYASAP